MVKPDANRIIFRWQAVTYNTPISPTATRGENPVSFEIELQKNGTILLRYGAGNQKLWPVVGIAADEPDAYPVASHTSETALKNLTNAQTVIFTPYSVAFPPPVNVASVTITPATVVAGKTATGKVTLSQPAPQNGAVVSLSDDLASTTMPATVTLPWLTTEATFTINTTHPGPAPQTGTVTAKTATSTASASLTVKPISPLTLSFSPNPVSGGSSVKGSLRLNGPAPAGGAVVALSDNLASATVPASVIVPAGVTTKTFTVTTAAVSKFETGTITAAASGTSRSVPLMVNPATVGVCAAPSFKVFGKAVTTRYLNSVAVGDFNRDGRPDLVGNEIMLNICQ